LAFGTGNEMTAAGASAIHEFSFDFLRLRYDLATDPAESHNLAVDHPGIVNALRSKVNACDGTLPTKYIKSTSNDDNN
jgi:hypothetical protein